MSKLNVARPTSAELAILQVLWDRGPSTVREVHDVLAGGKKKMGYTTVLKFLQIMLKKGLVVREESQRSHIYTAKLKQQATQRRLVSDLLERAFGGATEQLVLQALNAKKVSVEELDEIRRLLDEYKNNLSVDE